MTTPNLRCSAALVVGIAISLGLHAADAAPKAAYGPVGRYQLVMEASTSYAIIDTVNDQLGDALAKRK